MSGISSSRCNWVPVVSCFHWLSKIVYSVPLCISLFFLEGHYVIFPKSFLLSFKAGKLLFGRTSLVILIYLIDCFACKMFLIGMIFRSDLKKQEIVAVTEAGH